jgi:hypothetical protein
MESGELVVLVIGLCIVGCVCVAFVFAPRGLREPIGPGGPIGMGGPGGPIGPGGPGGPIGIDQSDRGPLLASS